MEHPCTQGVYKGSIYKENLTTGNKVTVKELRSLHDGGIE